MPKTEATCPECGISSGIFQLTGSCPACGTEALPERKEGELRYNAVQAIERSFRVFDMPATRAPGTECVDVGDIVDIVLREAVEWLKEQEDGLYVWAYADDLRKFISEADDG